MKLGLGAALALASVVAIASPAAADVVHFIPGTYYLTNNGTHTAPNDTLVLTVNGGIANFALTGVDNATFTVPDGSVPTIIYQSGNTNGPDPSYYIPGSGITASWNTSFYNLLTFYSANDGGAFEVERAPFQGGPLLYSIYESSDGPGVLFTLTRTPEPMTVALFGAGLAGAAAFRRRRAKR